ncbi:MAG: hypothetical protein K2Y42_20255 [Hyphomicrobium sp.]|jgi:hypothetical protein|uniref:hypothetical protein n=1 Tax=Hyphomicrobium sp. TaxID=82 RepID=UPI0025C6A3D0|nr:hypothetical protein [Hyphomicrobium sp.]MBX9865081.1 hypothetical protein [Hyphomicrobium sp.]
MTPSRLRPIASDAFEALIENTIIRCEDLYDLDGETQFRRRGGQIETFGPEVGQ